MDVEIVDTYIPVLLQYVHLHMYVAIKDQIQDNSHHGIQKSVGLCLILCSSHHFLIFVNPRYKKILYHIPPSFISRYYSDSLISHITNFIINIWCNFVQHNALLFFQPTLAFFF